MLENNHIVHGLWIGDTLSALELLTIYSFLQHGHEFHLWVYENIKPPIPKGVLIKDGNEILDRKFVFSYEKGDSHGLGKGSFAGFSDVFRYKLLHEKGGWWADMDITCLRPLEFDAPYVFRNHDYLPVVGNLMKCPKGCDLMKNCYEEAIQEVNAQNTHWLKPVEILNKHIKKLELTSYIIKGISNQDAWAIVSLYRYFSCWPKKNYYIIHWMNENWRHQNINKNEAVPNSTYAKLLKQYQIPFQETNEGVSAFKYFWWNFIVGLRPLIPNRLRDILRSVKRKWDS